MCEQPMQRSELQLHTVMSADTSVLTVRQALETAVILGYKALAITDRNSVQSFYSAALYYQQLHTALKLIYGAELANSDGCYTVLVKDAEGLKALYRLISGNEITPREREHLLFGSGNHNGALYGAVANGLNREELIQLAGEYDYIELYVGQGGYTHQEINKKLYALGEKLSIPVVAVGDCTAIPQSAGWLCSAFAPPYWRRHIPAVPFAPTARCPASFAPPSRTRYPYRSPSEAPTRSR